EHERGRGDDGEGRAPVGRAVDGDGEDGEGRRAGGRARGRRGAAGGGDEPRRERAREGAEQQQPGRAERRERLEGRAVRVAGRLRRLALAQVGGGEVVLAGAEQRALEPGLERDAPVVGAVRPQV